MTVTLRPTRDATFLNTVANHPDVRPWLLAEDGPAPLDFKDVIENPDNVSLVTETGGFVFMRHEDGIYEVHSLFIPEGRGTHTITAMRQAAQYMFVETDCMELLTKVPVNNTAAKGLARLAGFTHRFDLPLTSHGLEVAYLGLTLDRWMVRAPETRLAGEAFYALCDRPLEDPIHRHAVGTVVLMGRAGNATKGVETFNTLARFAGYPLTELVTAHPALVKIHGVVVSFRDGEMEIVTCH